MNSIEFRECGDCYACCSGALLSNSYGNTFGQGNACVFLVKKKCCIYENRPDVCRKYQCAWTQKLLGFDMRPDKCGVVVSVEIDENKKQYLKVIEINKSVTFETYQRLDECAKKLDTYWKKANEHYVYH